MEKNEKMQVGNNLVTHSSSLLAFTFSLTHHVPISIKKKNEEFSYFIDNNFALSNVHKRLPTWLNPTEVIITIVEKLNELYRVLLFLHL